MRKKGWMAGCTCLFIVSPPPSPLQNFFFVSIKWKRKQAKNNAPLLHRPKERDKHALFLHLRHIWCFFVTGKMRLSVALAFERLYYVSPPPSPLQKLLFCIYKKKKKARRNVLFHLPKRKRQAHLVLDVRHIWRVCSFAKKGWLLTLHLPVFPFPTPISASNFFFSYQ